MITYKQIDETYIEQALKIYEENNWKVYTADSEKTKRGFKNSLYILGAFDGDELVGFIRCIGDQEFVLYIQDLIIKPSHFRQGIGASLVKMISDRYPECRHFFLTTDGEDPVANSFYQAIGLTQDFNGWPINHYFRRLKK